MAFEENESKIHNHKGDLVNLCWSTPSEGKAFEIGSNLDKDALIKELVVESMELYLRSCQRLDSESWNTLTEHAPLIAEKVAQAHGLTRPEFRRYIAERGEIRLDQLKRSILKS